MDHEHGFHQIKHDQLEETPGQSGTSQEVARWVVAELEPGERVLIRVEHVFVGHIVATGRRMDLHTQ
jgi:hypothetical protein